MNFRGVSLWTFALALIHASANKQNLRRIFESGQQVLASADATCKDTWVGCASMATQAQAAGCTHTQAFDQMALMADVRDGKTDDEVLKLLGIHPDQGDNILAQTGTSIGIKHVAGGLCYGYVATWLAASKTSHFWNRVDKNYATQLKDWATKGVTLQAVVKAFKSQTTFSDEGEEYLKALGLNQALDSDGFQKKMPQFETPADMGKWMAKTGSRYYMLDTTGLKHTMGVAKDSHGLRFFDPNSGIVSCSNGAKLGDFLQKYVKDDKLTGQYKNLEIRKYK